MHLLSVISELLIFPASLSRSPAAFVLDCLSEPAKSTKCRLDAKLVTSSIWSSKTSPVFLSYGILTTCKLMIACEREEVLFREVSAILRCFRPRSYSRRASSSERTSLTVILCPYTPRSGSSLFRV